MIVTRFAPSPTGLLHLGHAYAAITAYESGDDFLLRIEDIDKGRSRDKFIQAIFYDLKWLGLSWDEPSLRQSTRMGAYAEALVNLKARGLVYPCFCTRAEIAAEIARAGEAQHGPDGPKYPGTCHALPPGVTKDPNLPPLPDPTNNIDLLSEVGSAQSVKNPSLATVYQRLKFNPVAGQTSISGFGLLHDGTGFGLPTVHPYVLDQFETPADFADVSAFVLCFGTGTAPTVGASRTVTSSNRANAACAVELLRRCYIEQGYREGYY